MVCMYVCCDGVYVCVYVCICVHIHAHILVCVCNVSPQLSSVVQIIKELLETERSYVDSLNLVRIFVFDISVEGVVPA